MAWKIPKVYGLKIYTRTTHDKNNGVYVSKMLGVIEGPVTKMMKAYPDEFSFMRHKTTRSIRPSKGGKN
jgi:uncharacterized membrane protein